MIETKIDKLTRSIENAISGDSVQTEVRPLARSDLKQIRPSDWLFNWKQEARQPDKTIYKLVIPENKTVIQGLINIQDKGDHVFMALLESSAFNRGVNKHYLGVPGNLVAFVNTRSTRDMKGMSRLKARRNL